MISQYPNTDPVITWEHKPDPEPLLQAFGYLPLPPLPKEWLYGPRRVYRCRQEERTIRTHLVYNSDISR